MAGRTPIPIVLNDRAYEKAHADRSARIVGEWLAANGATPELVGDVAALIRVHEWGGWPDADLVQAADSLSFLETNVDLMIGFVKSGKYSHDDIVAKIRRDVRAHRVPAAKELAQPHVARRDATPDLAVKPFEYFRPESLDELLALMNAHAPNARLLAGGTDLLVRARKGHRGPLVVVDVKRVAELRADMTRGRHNDPHRRAHRHHGYR